MPFEQSPQTWKIPSCQSTLCHGPRPRKHYHQLHGLTFPLSPTCCLQWPRRSCNLAFILCLQPYWPFPSTRTFAGVLDQVPWCPPTLLSYDLSTVEFAHSSSSQSIIALPSIAFGIYLNNPEHVSSLSFLVYLICSCSFSAKSALSDSHWKFPRCFLFSHERPSPKWFLLLEDFL